MTLTEEQKKEWQNWVNERPENVKKVVLKIVPWKTYRDIRIIEDIGNRYRPVSYEEEKDGRVTVTCEKTNEEMPILGGCEVFGMNPNNLQEAN